MIGQTLADYRIIKELGHGAMGIVYLAEEIKLGRQVAIKTLTDSKGPGNQHYRSRFLREARAVSALSHPHIATIYAYGEIPEPYIVMEYIRGENLADLMLKEMLTIPRSLEIIKEIAEALGEAHRHGIIHRDIKPSNIAINHRGSVKVLDFGLAKQIDVGPIDPSDPERQTLLNTQTREGMIVGTPMYLSPEQALGVELDTRSDLFSLGGVMYECIVGKPPFIGGSPIEICARVIRDDPPPPSQLNPNVSSELDRITLKTLAKKPEQRYQTADELIADLTQAQAEMSGQGATQTVTRLMPTHPNRTSGTLATLSDIFRRPRLSIGYVVAGLVVVAALSFGFWRITRATPHQPTLESQQFFAKGVLALQEGTYYKASKMLERSVAADNKFVLAHARLAEALTELDYGDKAKDEMLTAGRLITDRSVFDNLEKLYFDAVNSTVIRDLTGAIKAYEEIARLTSNDSTALVDLGRAYENNDEVEKAISRYQLAAEKDRNRPAAQIRLAVLYGRRQDMQKANAAFEQAERLYKDSDNFEGTSEVYYQRGLLLSQLGKVPEAREQAQKSLDIAKFAENKYQQVRALLLLGSIAYSSGDTAQGEQTVIQALDLARANDMETLATQGLLDLGYALILKRSYAEAERYLNQAFDRAQRFKEKRNEARANLLIGTLHIQKEEPDKADPYIDQALRFYRNGSYRREAARSMMMVGRQQLLKGDFESALRTLDEQLQLAKQVEDPGELARSQSEVGAALSKQDLYPQALIRYTESYELNKTLGNPLRTAFALLNRGDMLARLGRYGEAAGALDALVEHVERLSADNVYRNTWSAWGFLIRGRMALSERRYGDAKKYCQEALGVLADKDQNALAEINSTIGLIEVFSGNRAVGVKLAERALAIAIATKNERLMANVRLTLAEAQLESGNEQSALGSATQAREGLEKIRQEEFLWRAWLIGARSHQRLGNIHETREHLANARAVLARLQYNWGSDYFRTYSARADIKTHLQQLAWGALRV